MFCHIVVGENLQAIKWHLASRDDVVRITDHDTHLKVVALRPLDSHDDLLDAKSVIVKDETEHWDPFYWDVAMAAFVHAHSRGQDHSKALAVSIHYLCNLFLPNPGTSESPYLRELANRRDAIEAANPPDVAHGWELSYMEALR